MKKALPCAAAFLAVVLARPATTRASDHIDGVKTALDNSADLTDLYTFTSPRDPNKLVMVMNVNGFAFSRSRFSNAVDYRFRIRPIDDARTLLPSRDARREQTVTCTFAGGTLLLSAKQRATCVFDFGATSATVVFDTRSDGFAAGGTGSNADLRVFAGVRSDTWFLDLAKTVKYNQGIQVRNAPGINGLYGQNVLSIVVEADKRRFGGPLLAVTGQTVRR